jgi:hypothetical protein
MELIKIEDFFSKNTGFDTPKKLNRSTSKISQELLDEIENSGITSEHLETLGLPVFKYTTQITVHGLFPELGNGYVGRYKCLIRNMNESLGIKYLAVDKQRKERIYSALHLYGLNTFKDSSHWYAYKLSEHLPTQEIFTAKVAEYKALAAQIPMDTIVGSINIGGFRHPLFGTIHAQITVSINAVREVAMWNFIEKTTGKTRLEIETLEAQLKAESEARRAKEHAEYEAKEKIRSDNKKAMEAQLIAAGYMLQSVKSEGLYIEVDTDYSTNEARLNMYKVFLPERKKKFRCYEKEMKSLQDVPDFSKEADYSARVFSTWRKMWAKDVQPTFSSLTPKIEKKVATNVPNSVPQPISSADVKIINYSEKAIAVYGKTKPIKEQLKSIGARFNMFLTIEGTKQPGWVLPISQRSKLSFIQ